MRAYNFEKKNAHIVLNMVNMVVLYYFQVHEYLTVSLKFNVYLLVLRLNYSDLLKQ